MEQEFTKEQHAIKVLESLRLSATNTLDEFMESFKKRPSYAFKWQDSAMAAAALVDEIDYLLDALQSERVTVEQAIEHYRDLILRNAAYVPNSTSPCANLMTDYERAAKCKVLERLRYL